VEIELTLAADGRTLSRVLLADTGAGSERARFQLILLEDDCLFCGGYPLQSVRLPGAYSGSFPTYGLAVRLPALGFDRHLRAVGVPTAPSGFDGIACFGFLNEFSYGNFGDRGRFGVEV
jgi:hypothetical protein